MTRSVSDLWIYPGNSSEELSLAHIHELIPPVSIDHSVLA